MSAFTASQARTESTVTLTIPNLKGQRIVVVSEPDPTTQTATTGELFTQLILSEAPVGSLNALGQITGWKGESYHGAILDSIVTDAELRFLEAVEEALDGALAGTEYAPAKEHRVERSFMEGNPICQDCRTFMLDESDYEMNCIPKVRD